MRQSINSKRKSEGNDGTENISDQTFKKLNAIYFIPEDRMKWEIRILQGAKEQGNQWGSFIEHPVLSSCFTKETLRLSLPTIV